MPASQHCALEEIIVLCRSRCYLRSLPGTLKYPLGNDPDDFLYYKHSSQFNAVFVGDISLHIVHGVKVYW